MTWRRRAVAGETFLSFLFEGFDDEECDVVRRPKIRAPLQNRHLQTGNSAHAPDDRNSPSLPPPADRVKLHAFRILRLRYPIRIKNQHIAALEP
jgi:hypothetical protein